MSDASTSPIFAILRTYLKEASLELPQGSAVFSAQAAFEVKLNLTVEKESLPDGLYEVVVRATIAGESGDRVWFLLEAAQAGIYELRNIPPEQLLSILSVTCPSIIMPYLRSQVTDMLARATLPLVYLPEVNWTAIMEQQNTKQAATVPQRVPAPRTVH